jgi:hypothetical protein
VSASASAVAQLAGLQRQIAALVAQGALPRLTAVELAERAGIAPDPWQRAVLASRSSRILLNCSRQSGKSATAALLAAHTALYTPESLVLLLSPTQRQSAELFRTVLGIYRAAGQPIPAEAETLLRLELANGSRVLSLPGAERTVRGYSAVRLLVIDEAAKVPNELYVSVRPMLAVSGGRLICLSTPWGTRGFFYEAWSGSEAWERYEVPATRCPRIPAAFLEEERRSMGDYWFEAEYMCRFLDAQSQAFRREDIDRAFADEVDAWTL